MFGILFLRLFWFVMIFEKLLSFLYYKSRSYECIVLNCSANVATLPWSIIRLPCSANGHCWLAENFLVTSSPLQIFVSWTKWWHLSYVVFAIYHLCLCYTTRQTRELKIKTTLSVSVLFVDSLCHFAMRPFAKYGGPPSDNTVKFPVNFPSTPYFIFANFVLIKIQIIINIIFNITSRFIDCGCFLLFHIFRTLCMLISLSYRCHPLK